MISSKLRRTGLVAKARPGRLTLLAVALALAVGGLAYAAAPSSFRPISGCYAKDGGAVRLIDTGKDACSAASENPITWNQPGPAGPAGPAGSGGSGGSASALTATFGGLPPNVGSDAGLDPVWSVVVSKKLAAGSWALVATMNSQTFAVDQFSSKGRDRIADLVCELRNGKDTFDTSFVGSATDRQMIPADQVVKRTLTIVGGAQVPRGGGVVSVRCKSQIMERFDSALMAIKVGGFS